MSKKLKPLLSTIANVNRSVPSLQYVYVNDGKLMTSDYDSYLVIDTDLKNGYHAVKTLGLTEPIEHVTKFPLEAFKSREVLGVIDSHTISVKSLKFFTKFISKDMTRVFFTGLAINDGHFVACDGHRLVKERLKWANVEDVIIPNQALKYLLKLATMFNLKEVTFLVHKEHVSIRHENFTLYINLIKREYPRWQAVIPSKHSYKFTVNEWIDFKEFKPLFNKSMSCTISIEDKIVSLKIKGHNTNFLIGYANDGIKDNIVVNGKYLDDCIIGETIFIVGNNLSPIEFINNEGFTGVVMPMRE